MLWLLAEDAGGLRAKGQVPAYRHGHRPQPGADSGIPVLLRRLFPGGQTGAGPLHFPEPSFLYLPERQAPPHPALPPRPGVDHLLLRPFLERAEAACREKKLDFRLYALSNNGFVEGRQNELNLRLYEGWCRRSGAAWGGGLGLMGRRTRKGACGATRYTRVLIPSFLFLIGADIYMLLAALFRGTLPHKLFQKES